MPPTEPAPYQPTVADIERLAAAFAEQTATIAALAAGIEAADLRALQAEEALAKAEGSRSGLTEEQAREIAEDVATSFNARWSIGLGQGPLKDMADRIKTGVLSASRKP